MGNLRKPTAEIDDGCLSGKAPNGYWCRLEGRNDEVQQRLLHLDYRRLVARDRGFREVAPASLRGRSSSWGLPARAARPDRPRRLPCGHGEGEAVMRPDNAVHLVALSEQELEALRSLPALVEHLRATRAESAVLTLTAAAKRVRRRIADVAAAVSSGVLPAKRRGRTWAIVAKDADRWASA